MSQLITQRNSLLWLASPSLKGPHDSLLPFIYVDFGDGAGLYVQDRTRRPTSIAS